MSYTGTDDTLTFTNGEVSKYFTVPILQQHQSHRPAVFEPGVEQRVPTNALGSPSVAVLNIIDTTTVNETPGADDTTYSSFAGFNGDVFALALQPNNQLLAAGDFTQADGVPRQRIARLNADGSLDASFSLPSRPWAPTPPCAPSPSSQTGGCWSAGSSPISTAWP